LKVSKDKKKQFDVLKGLMNRSDVEYLVNGCDAGREGELIFQRVYVLAGCRKPVKRLWISLMEDAAIQKGFQTMKRHWGLTPLRYDFEHSTNEDRYIAFDN